jgi:hypothetical protein
MEVGDFVAGIAPKLWRDTVKGEFSCGFESLRWLLDILLFGPKSALGVLW